MVVAVNTDQRGLEGGKGFFGLHFFITVYYPGKPWQEFKAGTRPESGTETEAVEKHCLLARSHDLLAQLAFLCNQGPLAHGDTAWEWYCELLWSFT